MTDQPTTEPGWEIQGFLEGYGPGPGRACWATGRYSNARWRATHRLEQIEKAAKENADAI